MTFMFNGVAVESVQFNGTPLESLMINGVEVWSGGPKVAFSPASWNAPSGEILWLYLGSDGKFEAVEELEGNSQRGSWLDKPLQAGKTYTFTFTNTSVLNLPLSISGTFDKPFSLRLLKGETGSVTVTMPSGFGRDIAVEVSGDATGGSVGLEVGLGSSKSRFTISS